jgi:hypothetical protein
MRKTPLALLSASIVLICALLSIEIRTSVVTAKAETLGLIAETESSVSLDPTPQNDHFIWLLIDGDQSRPGYRRVVGGKHQDGTTMYICRVSGVTPGKLYNNSCHYSYVGQEYVVPSRYEVLLTDVAYEWRSFDELKRTQIKKGAVAGGSDSNGKDTLYMCRRHMSDGWHPGKYSYRNNLCYIPWGDQEKFYGKGFELLFPSQ